MKLQEAIDAAMTAAATNSHAMDVYLVKATGEFVVNDDYESPDNTSHKTHKHIGIAFPEQHIMMCDANDQVIVDKTATIPAEFCYSE